MKVYRGMKKKLKRLINRHIDHHHLCMNLIEWSTGRGRCFFFVLLVYCKSPLKILLTKIHLKNNNSTAFFFEQHFFVVFIFNPLIALPFAIMTFIFALKFNRLLVYLRSCSVLFCSCSVLVSFFHTVVVVFISPYKMFGCWSGFGHQIYPNYFCLTFLCKRKVLKCICIV